MALSSEKDLASIILLRSGDVDRTIPRLSVLRNDSSVYGKKKDDNTVKCRMRSMPWVAERPRQRRREYRHSTLMLFSQCQRRRQRSRWAIQKEFVSTMLPFFPHGRRFWSAHPTTETQAGFWEREVLGNWLRIADRDYCLEWLDSRYVATFRVDYTTFQWILSLCCEQIQRKTTHLRNPIPAAKKLAVTLQWLANGLTEANLANEYCLGVSTVHLIVHEVVDVLLNVVLKDSIVFPTGQKLEETMAKFEAKSHLKMCAGSLDGTFMKIRKPHQWGDAYWCYKNYCAITILAVVDADGLFTYVDAGRAGSLGDAFTYNHSGLKARIETGDWLNERHSQVVNGRRVRPYLVADSVFALSSTVIKGYDHPPAPGHQRSFNAAVVKARRVVETTFGKTKGRFHILMNNFLNDPDFAADIALLCCAMNNVCERANCPFSNTWLANEDEVHVATGGGGDVPNQPAALVRLALAQHVHANVPLP